MTELPTAFGKYYLTEKLATGGMAEIYLAKIIGPSGFEKPLVIKQIHPTLSGNRHFVDLFVAEAKILVTLAHGNIVPVYELGVVDDTYFIAMEYIDGPTLYRLTETMASRDVQMEPAIAAWITARILDGLDYAHRKGEGVIHRDLSPRNVMLSRDGEVKLVDFGIAVTLGADGEAGAAQSAPTGSFPYMSPEQVRREPLTGQTDLFSLGVLAWEMLAGRRLFARADADQTLAAVLGEPIPPPSSVRPEVPAKLDEAVMRALERERSARWPSAGDMLAPLNRYLYSLDATPGPRDVAALVARHCPPETRRLPTSQIVSDAGAPEPAGPGGPRTAVIPRDGAAPRGRPQRHRTFATNVEVKEILDRATPLLGVEAIADVARSAASPARSEPVGAVLDPNVTAKLARPPNRSVLVLTGIGGIALAAAAVYIFFANRDRVLRSERDAALPAASDVMFAEPPPDAARLDAPADAPAGALADAMPEEPRDAGVRRSDAGRTAAPPRPDAPTRTTATLQIGANPWGEIYIDGKLVGRTPRELTVPAGRHTIEIVFPAESPPRKQTFAVDLAAGETKPLQADFTP
jgi:serine/threonine protein kinase